MQPHIGGDLALLTGIAKRIVELNAHDVNFLENTLQQLERIGSRILAAASWDEITTKSGVSYEQIDAIAQRYAKAKNVVFSWTMGITHHAHGVQNVQAIANLALLRGMVGRPNAGLLPIRGHSNVQGIGSVGVTPKLKDAIFERLESHFGVCAADIPKDSTRWAAWKPPTPGSSSSASAWEEISMVRTPTRPLLSRPSKTST